MTKNFSNRELQCRCGCGALPNQDFMNRVQVLRDILGTPLIVNSAMRCAEHNRAIGGAANSHHLSGNAIDLRANNGMEAYQIGMLAFRLGFTGIGVGETFIHIDTRAVNPILWRYLK